MNKDDYTYIQDVTHFKSREDWNKDEYKEVPTAVKTAFTRCAVHRKQRAQLPTPGSQERSPEAPMLEKLPRSPPSTQACLWSNPVLDKLPRSPTSTQACLRSKADHCSRFCVPEELGTTEKLVWVAVLTGSSTKRLLTSGRRATS